MLGSGGGGGGVGPTDGPGGGAVGRLPGPGPIIGPISCLPSGGLS